MIEAFKAISLALADIEADAKFYRERAKNLPEDEARWWNLKAEICNDNAVMLRRREHDAYKSVQDEWEEFRALARKRIEGQPS